MLNIFRITLFYLVPLGLGVTGLVLVAREAWGKGYLSVGEVICGLAWTVMALVPLFNLMTFIFTLMELHERHQIFSRKLIINRRWEQEQAVKKLRGDRD